MKSNYLWFIDILVSRLEMKIALSMESSIQSRTAVTQPVPPLNHCLNRGAPDSIVLPSRTRRFANPEGRPKACLRPVQVGTPCSNQNLPSSSQSIASVHPNTWGAIPDEIHRAAIAQSNGWAGRDRVSRRGECSRQCAWRHARRPQDGEIRHCYQGKTAIPSSHAKRVGATSVH